MHFEAGAPGKHEMSDARLEYWNDGEIAEAEITKPFVQ
jgi:hypothetical protein